MSCTLPCGLQADLPQLVAQIGRLCECKAGPAGAVSGYLAFGSSMDYVYMMKKVPYPLTVEVYGGGDIGKLQPGRRAYHSVQYVAALMLIVHSGYLLLQAIRDLARL